MGGLFRLGVYYKRFCLLARTGEVVQTHIPPKKRGHKPSFSSEKRKAIKRTLKYLE